MITIDRCVCHRVSFSEIITTAKKNGIDSLEQLREFVSFGTKCRLCTPYVQRGLQTGETVFHSVIQAKK